MGALPNSNDGYNFPHHLLLINTKVLIPLGLTAATSATDAAIRKKTFTSGMITLIISNEEMNDVMKIVKSFEEAGLVKQSKMKQRTNSWISLYVIRYIRF